MNEKSIRVLVVDDSLTALQIISRVLSTASDIEIVAKASDPETVVDLIKELKPDIACIDYFMPKLNGLELTKKIMAECPLPILIVSGQLVSKECKEIFSILEAGALDFFPKPVALTANPEEIKKLIEKIRVLSKVFVVKKLYRSYTTKISPLPTEQKNFAYSLVVIGASTGGPSALAAVLGKLPKNFPVPIVCVQHISNGFLEGFVDWIDSFCALKVKIMNPQEIMQPGYIYLPMEDTHLEFTTLNQLVVSKAPPIQQHRPAVDVTMSSAAKHFGKKVIAVLLTGMGSDGAKGMLEVFQAGGVTIAQNEASCVVFGMPKEAIDLHAVKYVLDLKDIPSLLEHLLKPNLQTNSSNNLNPE